MNDFTTVVFDVSPVLNVYRGHLKVLRVKPYPWEKEVVFKDQFDVPYSEEEPWAVNVRDWLMAAVDRF